MIFGRELPQVVKKSGYVQACCGDVGEPSDWIAEFEVRVEELKN